MPGLGAAIRYENHQRIGKQLTGFDTLGRETDPHTLNPSVEAGFPFRPFSPVPVVPPHDPC